MSGLDLRLFGVVFGTVFLAELGDKTQLATLLYAAKATSPKLTVFLASAAALVLASAIGVLAGSLLSGYLNERLLAWIAGLSFIAVGIWTIVSVVPSAG